MRLGKVSDRLSARLRKMIVTNADAIKLFLPVFPASPTASSAVPRIPTEEEAEEDRVVRANSLCTRTPISICHNLFSYH